MEKAILKTLAYADIFDYPLSLREIHKWLIGRKATLRQIEKAVGELVQSARCKAQGGYYFLPRKPGLVGKRKRREKQSASYFQKAKILCQILKLIPWIKLVGVSGALAMKNAGKSDDIDLLIVTSKNRLWISRLLALGLLSLTGQRRKVGEKGRKIAGKLCINILLEEDRLEQQSKDIFVAHEVLQMKVLWQRGGIYSKYLEDNEWAFKFLPNWIGVMVARRGAKKRSHGRDLLTCENFVEDRYLQSLRKSAQNLQHFLTARDFATLIVNYLEDFAKRWQLKIMKQPQGMERIEDGAVYFHPQDCRNEILSKYQQKLKRIISSGMFP
ncbi:MAG: hypothetical protein PHV63_02290 [Candidatus Daviesbacteria bacterium]|nr:hypothetical protein [Candidatus Daviesbacteria bacterium]